MKIRKVKIHNILSIADLELEFGDSGLVLLDGYNYDDDSCNGAGKSAIFNALSFGLYGKMPRDITSTEYLRKGTKAGFAEVTVDCGNDTWVVTRHRPTNISFLKNGSKESIEQQEFEIQLKLNYQQFLLTIYASQLKTDKFLLLNDSGKKDFLLQLMNLDVFSDTKDLTSKLTRDLKTRIVDKEKESIAASTKIKVLEESIIDSDLLYQQLAKCDLSIVDRELSTLILEEPDLSQLTEIERQIANKRRNFDDLRVEVRTLRNERESLLRQKHTKSSFTSIACPHCDSGVIVTTKGLLKSTDIEKRNIAIDDANTALDDQAKELSSKINDLEDKLIEVQQLDILEEKLKQKRSQKMSEYNCSLKCSLELKHLRDKLIQEAKFIQAKIDSIDNIKNKISILRIQLEKIDGDRSSLQEELVTLETIVSIFSPTGVQAYIADLVLDLLNEKVSEYISQIWPNASYRLLSYKENKSGEIKTKFSEKIIVAGKERSLGSLSGGEFRCISLAVDLAVFDVVTQMFGVDINLMILDEVFDGMDNSNRERTMLVLANLAATREIYLIDHSSEVKSMFSKTVRVEKRNEITALT